MSTNHPEPNLRQFPSEARRSALEILFGRALAACVHTFAAWRRFSRSWRLWIVAAYIAAGYVIVFTLLVMLWHA